MNKKHLTQKLATCIVSLLLCLPQVVAASAAPAKAKGPMPLSAGELYEMYKDKTWTWSSGGGRFDSQGRRFVAYVNDKGKQSYAEGTWDVDDLGKMCMRATWTTPDGPGGSATCFGHQKIGNVIYQRRHPNGDWYVFRHSRPKPGDEFLKLVSSDNVTMKALALKQSLMAKK